MWNVEFSYNIVVDADTPQEAEAKAGQEWDEIAPKRDEMNIKTSSRPADT